MDMYIQIATKMLLGAFALFIVIRVIGKKAISEFTPFDLIYILILGALVEESIYDDQVSIFHILFAIALWGIVVHVIETILEKTEKVSTAIQGEPSILIDKGKLNLEELEKNYLDMERLRAMLRQHNCYSINEVYYAILEINGGLTLITKENQESPTFLIVENGKVKPKTLSSIGKSAEWLRTSLAEMGYTDLEEIIYCEWHEGRDELIVDTYDNTIREKIYIDD